MVDWGRFCVPVGTTVRFKGCAVDTYGILLENKPGLVIDRAVRMYQTQRADLDKIAVQYFEDGKTHTLRPESFEYLINDQWLTFNQVMALTNR